MRASMLSRFVSLALVLGVILSFSVWTTSSKKPLLKVAGEQADGPNMPVRYQAPEPPTQRPVQGPILGSAVQPVSFNGDLRTLPRPNYNIDPNNAPEIISPEPANEAEEEGGTPRKQAPTSALNVQRAIGESDMPAPSVVFDGLANFDNIAAVGGTVNPPDPSGDIGRNHYIQAVNLVFRIFDKSGTALIPPTKISTLFAAGPTNTPCDTLDNGDPIVLYDQMADRWVVTQFGVPGPDYYECIAVSKTGDPVSGGWWLYVIKAPYRIFNDYPKLSVWPDAYYMSAPMFPNSGEATFGAVWALDRAAMLAGRATRQVYFTFSPDFARVLPSNLRGDAPPPGSPNYILAHQAPDKLQLWKFKVDWNNPADSTLTGPTALPVLPFAEACPNTRDCVPFNGSTPTTLLDDLSPRLMMQLQYRRVGDVESLWANHTVDVNGRTVPRWYEVRSPGGTPVVHQQSSYAPDSDWRWMGSIAADKDGNAALGYSASNPSIKPSIRYTGRLATDPINLMAQSEITMTVGTGHPTTANSRWGDYTIMSVDPVDDCTFWYQNEYYKEADTPIPAGNRWSTSIGAFKFPSCTPLPATGTITGTVFNTSNQARVAFAPISVYNATRTHLYSGATDGNGVYSIPVVLPGTYTVVAEPINPGYLNSSSVANVVVTSNATTRADIGLTGTPTVNRGAFTFVDSSPGGNGNGYAEPGERNIQLNVQLENTGLAGATGVTATLISLTPGVTVQSASSTYPNLGKGAQTNNTPFVVSINTLACGVRLDFRLVVTTDQGNSTFEFSTYAGLPGNPISYTSTNVPQAIPNTNPVDVAVGATAEIDVSDTFAVAKAQVTINIAHTNDADVQVHVSDPSGREIELSSDNGGTADNYINTTFDDDATTAITAGTAPFTGLFRPEGRLAEVQGIRANGRWELHAYDDLFNGGGTGSITGFQLSLTPFVCTFPVPNLDIASASATENGGNTNGNGTIDPGENSIDLTVALQNGGIPNIAAASNVIGTLVPRTAGVTLNVGSSAYPDIDPNQNRTNTTPYNIAVSPDVPCGLPLQFDMNIQSAQGTFVDRFSVPTGGATISTTVLSENVENGANGWTVESNFSGADWTITTEKAHSPTHSWTDSPGGNYPNGATLSLVSPLLDLSGFDTVKVDFWHIFDLELDFDYGYVEYSTDGGTTWSGPAATYTGDVASGTAQTTWALQSVNLNGLAHAQNARMRFRFSSDGGVVADGWYIDDISIYGDQRTCQAPLAPTATATPEPSATATATPIQATTVNIQSFAFQPSNVTINVGESVRWVNLDNAPHTSTSNTGVWNSGTLTNGQSFTFTFPNAGVFPYFCQIHPNMQGTVTVLDPNAPTATATAPASSPTRTATAPAASPTRTSTTGPTATSTAQPLRRLYMALIRR